MCGFEPTAKKTIQWRHLTARDRLSYFETVYPILLAHRRRDRINFNPEPSLQVIPPCRQDVCKLMSSNGSFHFLLFLFNLDVRNCLTIRRLYITDDQRLAIKTTKHSSKVRFHCARAILIEIFTSGIL